MHRMKIVLGSIVVVAVLAASLTLAGVTGAATKSKQGVTLNLVAYSTPKPVMTKLIAAYQQSPAGQGISFTTSYGGSSAQAAGVAAGQPADVVILSTGTDVNLLVDKGLVDANWRQAELRRRRLELGRRLRAPEREPEAHQGLERPGQAGRRRPDPATRSPPASPSGTS